MNWLEKKILLHFLKQFLERASTMKLSWNLVFQGIALLVQAGNQYADILPAKWKPVAALILGLAQAAVAWRSHYFNPDGTPAKVAYIPNSNGGSSLKIVAFLLVALLTLSAVHAQAQTSLYAGGVSFNNGAKPSIAGTGLYAHSIDSVGTYAFTAVDVLPNTLKPLTVTTNISAGPAQKLFTLGKVPIYGTTAAGISFQGSNTGWAWNGGFLASVHIKKHWYAYPTVRVAKSSVSNGTGYQPIVGVLFGYSQ